jgi:hypothetical protein
MAASAKNPFAGSSFEGESNSKLNTNPFDDNPSNTDGASSNPFTSDDECTSSVVEDDLIGNNSHEAPAEASWQYLGDLPYRRVPIYSNVQWQRLESSSKTDPILHHGLASFPSSAVKHHPRILDTREVRNLLKTTTTTQVKACPHGGPIAVVTLPVVGHAETFPRTELRISTNAGQPLAQVDVPPAGLEHKYSPADVLTLGFTSRTPLVLVMKDSLCLTYDLRGDVLLPPFHILP